MFRFFRGGASDLANYRAGYPDKVEQPRQSNNLKFYLNKIAAEPEDLTIDELHETKGRDYRWLERCHSFIQWLFPIQEPGLNPDAQVLMKHEIAAMRADGAVQERIWKSFNIMLRFYGMQVTVDPALEKAGQVPKFYQSTKLAATPWRPATGGSNENQQLYHFAKLNDEVQPQLYKNLNTSGHNYLRITRILKFLGEMGMEDVKISWLVFLAQEVLLKRDLWNCRDSLVDYWSGTIYDDGDRDAFVQWCHKLEVMSSVEEKQPGSKRRVSAAADADATKSSEGGSSVKVRSIVKSLSPAKRERDES